MKQSPETITLKNGLKGCIMQNLENLELLNDGFDHVEFVVNDIRPMGKVFERLGFETIATRESEGAESVAYAQGRVRIILTQPDSEAPSNVQSKSKTLDFLRKHAEGVCVLALEVKDATRAFEETVKNGARPAKEPSRWECPEGTIVRSEIWTPGDIRYAFIERKSSPDQTQPAPLDQNLVAFRLQSPSPLGIQKIDHLTNNVGMGQMREWVDWYKQVFGFGSTRHFDIRTQRTGLLSEVVESPCRRIKVPVNEPTEPESQIQEFVNRMKGPGVQHLALLSSDLIQSLQLMKKRNFTFLTVPHTYYEAVPTRVPGVTENLSELEEMGILLDGDQDGYLIQIFSEEILGPFFFEYIQRKGNQGFGEGNFKALFESIERDQIRRGVLKE